MSAKRFRLHPKLKIEDARERGVGVVVDTESGLISSCNESAVALLERLKEGATLNELSRELVMKFLITDDQARRDAEDFFQRLSAMGLIDEVA